MSEKVSKEEALGHLLAIPLVSALYAWWSTWLAPHLFDKEIGFWLLFNCFCLVCAVIHEKLWSFVTLALLIPTIYIWIVK